MVKCENCGRTLANSVYISQDTIGNEIKLCPICVLGSIEGGQSKYWETSKQPNAGHPEGFRYADDTAKYKYHWNGQKWIDKEGIEKGKEK